MDNFRTRLSTWRWRMRVRRRLFSDRKHDGAGFWLSASGNKNISSRSSLGGPRLIPQIATVKIVKSRGAENSGSRTSRPRRIGSLAGRNMQVRWQSHPARVSACCCSTLTTRGWQVQLSSVDNQVGQQSFALTTSDNRHRANSRGFRPGSSDPFALGEYIPGFPALGEYTPAHDMHVRQQLPVDEMQHSPRFENQNATRRSVCLRCVLYLVEMQRHHMPVSLSFPSTRHLYIIKHAAAPSAQNPYNTHN